VTRSTRPPGAVARRAFPRRPASRAPRLAACLLACASTGLACASTSPEDPDYGQPPDLAEATVAFAGAVKTGAGSFSRGMGTAYRGVRAGFEEPGDAAACGPYPKDYVTLVKRHFARVLRYGDDASYRLGRPSRGYMNHGLLRGGGVAWQGWLVDVEVETRQRMTGHRSVRGYVVRLRGGEVVDVHTDASLLRRL
jgi:hypothetical protein